MIGDYMRAIAAELALGQVNPDTIEALLEACRLDARSDEEREFIERAREAYALQPNTLEGLSEMRQWLALIVGVRERDAQRERDALLCAVARQVLQTGEAEAPRAKRRGGRRSDATDDEIRAVIDGLPDTTSRVEALVRHFGCHPRTALRWLDRVRQ